MHLHGGGLVLEHACHDDVVGGVEREEAIELASQEDGKITVDLQPVWQALSEVLDLAGDLTGARKAAEQVVALTADKASKADAIRQVGKLCEKAGDRAGAANHYGEAL